MSEKLRTACIVVFLLLSVPLFSYTDKGHLFLSAKISAASRSSENISVKVTSKGSQVMSFITKKDGNFSIYLDLQTTYEVRCSLEGFHDAVLKLSTQVPPELESGKYELFTDLALISNTKESTAPSSVRFRRADRQFIVEKPAAPPEKQQARQVESPEVAQKNQQAEYIAAQKQKQDEQKKNAGAKAEANADFIKTIAEASKKGKGESQQEEDKYKKVSVLTIIEGGKKHSYRKVEYKWGSVYYYKNGEQISEKQWLKETASVRNQKQEGGK